MKLARWEFIGVLIVCGLGIFLHFAYELSDNNQYVALVAPINNTLGEQLKVVFYGMILYALFEYIFMGKDLKNFIFAKAFSSILACFLIIVCYFGYTQFVDANVLLNLVAFVIAILVAQFFSYAILKLDIYIKGLNYISLIVLVAAAIILAGYTYHPLQNDYFKELLKLEV